MTTRVKFIVVEHDAQRARLHWDLRFEDPNKRGIWMSFAVRKGIPLQPGTRVLAIRTHDHSAKEALFLGKIDTGYGAGQLKKWDDGYCIIHKFKPGHKVIEFKGRKVKGFYHLVSTGVIKKSSYRDQDYKNQTYMLFKGKSLNEGTGMISRIPSILYGDEVEEGQGEEGSEKKIIKKLPWSKIMSTYINKIGDKK